MCWDLRYHQPWTLKLPVNQTQNKSRIAPEMFSLFTLTSFTKGYFLQKCHS